MGRIRKQRPSLAVVVAVVLLVGGGAAAGVTYEVRSGGTPEADRVDVHEHFRGCDVKPETARWKRITARAQAAVDRGEGYDRATSDAWLRTQGLMDRLMDAMRSSSPAGHYDYVDMAFHNRTLTTDFAVRNHHHDAAIRECAAKLRLFGHLRILIFRWTPGQLGQAADRFGDRVHDLEDRMLVETDQTYGDKYNIRVYRKATAADRARILQAARAVGVPFKIIDEPGDMPVASPA